MPQMAKYLIALHFTEIYCDFFPIMLNSIRILTLKMSGFAYYYGHDVITKYLCKRREKKIFKLY